MPARPLGLAILALLVASIQFVAADAPGMARPLVGLAVSLVAFRLFAVRTPTFIRRLRLACKRWLRRLTRKSKDTPESVRELRRRLSSTRLENQLLKEIHRQKSSARALNVLVRRIALEAHDGFVAVLQEELDGAVRVTNSRGLTDRSPRLELEDALRQNVPVRLADRTLRRSELFESLAPADRRRIRDAVYLISFGRSPARGWLLTTRLLPLHRSEDENLERLQFLCGVAARHGLDDCVDERHSPGPQIAKASSFAPPLVQLREILESLRTAAQFDRVSLSLLNAQRVLAFAPTLTVGRTNPHGIEQRCRMHERRVGLDVLSKGRVERYDAEALRALGVDTLWGRAAAIRISVRGQSLGIICCSSRQLSGHRDGMERSLIEAADEIAKTFERMLPPLPFVEPDPAPAASEKRQVSPKAAAATRHAPLPTNVAAAFLGQDVPSAPLPAPLEPKKTPGGDLQQGDRSETPAATAPIDPRDQFFASMTHELRAPMTGILGMTELVLDTSLTEKQRECLASVRSSSQSLLQLVNDLLDFSKLEARGVEVERIDFSLRSTLREALLPLAVQARQKGLDFRCELPKELEDVREGDPLRLRQVVTNLVGNALKFTESGGIHVRAARDDDGSILVSVQDTGPGIPADRQERIFERFAQADASTARRFGGTGLGLAISRQLVELMGGRLWLESEVGRGTTFHFTLRCPPAKSDAALRPTADARPLTAVADERAQPESNEPADSQAVAGKTPGPLRILLVDDHEINRSVGRLRLEAHGHAVDVATDGVEACDAVERNAYDVVLMDVQMPELDGLSATRAIRRHHAPNVRGVRIFALTSVADGDDRAACLDAGMDDVLLKPVHSAAFHACFERHSAQSTEPRVDSGFQTAVSETAAPHLVALRASFLPMFLPSAASLVDEVREGALQADFERIRRASHSLNGSSSTLGFEILSETARQIELAARRQDVDDVRSLLSPLAAALDACRPVLSSDSQVHSTTDAAKTLPPRSPLASFPGN